MCCCNLSFQLKKGKFALQEYNYIMMKKLLLGDEAIAQGAIDAGLSGVYAYPGTPSTEITEYIQGSPGGVTIGTPRFSNSSTKYLMKLGLWLIIVSSSDS